MDMVIVVVLTILAVASSTVNQEGNGKIHGSRLRFS